MLTGRSVSVLLTPSANLHGDKEVAPEYNPTLCFLSSSRSLPAGEGWGALHEPVLRDVVSGHQAMSSSSPR